MADHRPVRQLSVDVARKIAAGEVIDRPQAIVRELMDNAVDSGADKITVEITGGGIEKIRISDNGSGMTKEDLKACARPHCTSKISDSEDLLNLTTLGFRGEALSSIAAVSRLSIASGTYKMRASITEDHIIEPIPPVQDGRGTIVTSEGLFENFPARRVFLKRPSSETMMCRDTFVEKSIPRPDISFRLIVDGAVRADLPSGVSLSERFARALELKESSSLFSELKASGTEADGKSKWSFSLVIGEPSVFRGDRKNIYIFVNGRRVSEYSLLQAIEYGCQGFFPNGTHPVAALFLRVEPKMVDFNIHPAKKEVRFKDISSVHHGVSSTVRAWLKGYSIKESKNITDEDSGETAGKNSNKNENAQQRFNFSNLVMEAFSEDSKNSTRRFPENFTEDFSEAKSENSFEKSEKSSFFEKSGNFDNSENFDSQKNYSDSSRQKNLGNLIESDEKNYADPFTGKTLSAQFEALNFSLPRKESVYNTSHTGASKESLLDFDKFSSNQKMSNIQMKTLAEPDALSQPRASFAYLGTVFGTFLLAIYKDTLYMIDQHAAHERINFNRIMAAGGEKQKLLVPYEIHTESKSDDDYLESIKGILESSGFETKNKGNGLWEISSIPARFNLSQKDLEEALLKDRKSPDEIIYHIAATTACRMSVKDGTILGPKAAEELAWEALHLKDPHCPHGRPVWTTFTKEELFARVRRTR
ncbi:MAG: DNA mismatch repair endonuclease MutL [Treponema sp.]|nr:DNA mismatch repair endonuclease MutL [Treponema sp.]